MQRRYVVRSDVRSFVSFASLFVSVSTLLVPFSSCPLFPLAVCLSLSKSFCERSQLTADCMPQVFSELAANMKYANDPYAVRKSR